jgi:hypothetical protein
VKLELEIAMNVWQASCDYICYVKYVDVNHYYV